MQISSQRRLGRGRNLVYMGPRNFPFMLLAAGFVAAMALSRKASDAQLPQQQQESGNSVPRRFVVAKDAPALNLRRGQWLRVEPEALIRVGDLVALKSEQPEVVLTRFHDELMHCVAGLVVREPEVFSRS